jgi:glycosyltransferase involved in cell wall biosynthesis
MDTRTVPQWQHGTGDDLRTVPELADLDTISTPLHSAGEVKHRASVSVIVPTFFNAGLKQRSLAFLLGGLARSQNVREVVLVSSDGENSSFADLLPLMDGRLLRVTQAEPHNRSQSRNNGAAFATGDYLLFMDDDMLLKDWRIADVILSELVEQRFDCALFPRRNYVRFPALYDRYCLEDIISSWRAGRCDDNPFFFDPLKRGTTRDLPLLFCYPGCFTMIRRDAFHALGGFDQSYVGWGFEDADFALRAMQQLRVLNLFRKSEPLLHIDHPVSPYKSDEFAANHKRFHESSLRLNLGELCRVVFRGTDFCVASGQFWEGAPHLEPFRCVAEAGVPLPLAELDRWFISLAEQQNQRFCRAEPEFILLHGSRATGEASPDADYDVLCLYQDGGIQEFLTTRGTPPVEIECADMRAFRVIAEQPAHFDYRGALDLAKLARGRLLWGNAPRWRRWRKNLLAVALKNGRCFWMTLGLGLRLHGKKHGTTVERFLASVAALETAARVRRVAAAPAADLKSAARAVAAWLDRECADWRGRTLRAEKVFPLQIPEVWTALHWLVANVAPAARPRHRNRQPVANVPDARHVLVCTIEPHLTQAIGAALQWLSLRTVPQCRYLVRIVDGDLPEQRGLAALLRELGVPHRSLSVSSRNRYLNKWTALAPDFLGATVAAVIDWDIINVSAVALPEPVGRTLSARKNPDAGYAEFATRLRDLAPQCWDGPLLRSAINSGFVLAAPAVLAQMADRTIELVAELEKRGLGDPPWQVEQLAASLAAGEAGLTALGDEWNVTPQSPVPDRAVRLWHFNDALAATRTIKRNLGSPEVVLEALAELESSWPTAVHRFRQLYNEVMNGVQLPRLRRRASRRTGRVTV